MGLSFRKSFGSGPFRINLSKSGVSYSFGVKGARINTGPRGTYVNMASHGIYYRKKIDGYSTHQPITNHIQPPVETEYHGIHTITSASIDQLTDSDSKDFINELSENAKKLSLVNWLGILPFIIFCVFLTYFSFENKDVITMPESNKIMVIINNYDGLNIRSEPNAHSKILKAVNNGQEFQLIDSTNSKWSKISFNDTIGYVSKAFSIIKHEHKDKITDSQTFLNNKWFGYEFIAGLIFFGLLIYKLNKEDRKRLEMEITYEMDEQTSLVYQKFSQYFSEFTSSAKMWQYLHSQGNIDYKRNAGAGKLINRISIRSVSGNKVPLRFFKTNVNIPNIKLRNTDLYFLPERLLVKRNGSFAAVFYKHLDIKIETTRFIESESVPNDAKVIDYTWRYVNKNGSPDRRFNGNRRIPICAYSEYTITSETGIYEVITTSKSGAFDKFATFLHQIRLLQSKMELG